MCPSILPCQANVKGMVEMCLEQNIGDERLKALFRGELKKCSGYHDDSSDASVGRQEVGNGPIFCFATKRVRSPIHTNFAIVNDFRNIISNSCAEHACNSALLGCRNWRSCRLPNTVSTWSPKRKIAWRFWKPSRMNWA